jgi:preprotein translocase subunit SecA
MYRYSSRAREGQSSRIDREQLIAWARERFDVQLDLEDLKNKQRDEIRAVLLGHSKAHHEQAAAAAETVRKKLAALSQTSSNGNPSNGSLSNGRPSGGNGSLDSLADWCRQTLKCELSAEELAQLEPDEIERKLLSAVEDRYNPEMRRMERAVLLQIVDTAWKDHLLAMDYLLAAVRLKGWGQLDPKVEYKREGMQLFKKMWNSAGERVTDLIFRMEQLDEDFVGSTWVETSARHDEAQAASDIAAQQQAAIDASRGDEKIEPIRNRGQRVGRNDPCPCGSGRKYKQCCMRKERIA